ncbi:MAG: hypothetical protein JSS11_08570 [Verrucomicrobia bacterium]|nr:hypothetical protein [Verrucomicrobiota bacterium]
MKIVMKMPDLATTDSAIKVIRWLIEIGQPVQRGQILLEVETDKATMEVESIATGKLLAYHAQPGDALTAGQPLVSLDVEGIAPPRPAAPAPLSGTEPTPPPQTAPVSASPVAPKTGGMFARNRSAQSNPTPKP